jgi:hypothetical protein
MNKIEFLAASLPYKLECRLKHDYAFTSLNCLLTGIYVDNDDLYVNLGVYDGDDLSYDLKNAIPIIRHLDSLTQECVQDDYNNGEPFIPIVELAKMAVNGTEDFIENSIQSIYYFIDNKNFSRMEFLPFVIIQQLLKWHFWPAMPDGEEVVCVSDDFNPYK